MLIPCKKHEILQLLRMHPKLKSMQSYLSYLKFKPASNLEQRQDVIYSEIHSENVSDASVYYVAIFKGVS